MLRSMDPVAPPPLAHRLLDSAELEEFRTLARRHAGAELTTDEARTVSSQLLRVLAIVRDVSSHGSNESVSPVDGRALPKSAKSGITTVPPA